MKAVLLAAAAAFTVTGCVMAESPGIMTFDGLVGSQNVDTDGDVEMNGVAIDLAGRVGGNAVLNGAAVDVDARIGGDLEVSGGAADIRGSVAGRMLLNAGAADVEGSFDGPVEINAGAVELDGAFAEALTANAGALEFSGDAYGPVAIAGSGRDRNWRGRPRQDESKVEIDGVLHAGGAICAHEVRFSSNARVDGPLTVTADAEPDYPAGFDASNIRFGLRDGNCT